MTIERPAHQLYPSPLRYPGGKGKLANYIKMILVENELVGSEYVEPYAGGAAVALSLLFEEYADHVHINDINRGLFSFWKIALADPDELSKRIRSAKLSVAEWDRQRRVQLARDPDEIDLAFSTLYMSRTNRSGILTGGIIGGRDQTGDWKIDARWRPDDLVHRIEKIARFASRITVTKLDTADYIRTVVRQLRDPFLYLDPPYYRKGRRLYQDFYEHEDHELIAELVTRLPNPWVVSYDATPEIEELYGSANRVRYGPRYTARRRFEGSELMFFSKGLRIPQADRPAHVTATEIHAARSAA